MRNNMAAGWFYSPQQIAGYLSTRLTSLKPPRSKVRNPVDAMGELDSHHWLMFLAGFFCWVWDAFDFSTVTLCVTEIAAEFNTSNSAIVWAITITLLLRPVGAVVIGVISDRYGRRFGLIAGLCLFVIFELASGFAQTLRQFLGTRALYGIAMGGIYGPAAATAIEDLPYDARGLFSGLFVQGFSVGSLLAAIFYRALVPTTIYGWRSLFWFGAGPPVLIIAYVWWLPETNASQVMRAERKAAIARRQDQGTTESSLTKAWSQDIRKYLRESWPLFIYFVFLLTGLHTCSHGSADLYPTFLKNQLEMSPSDVTIITVAGQIGAIIFGAVFGYMSTFFGRRLTMIFCCVISCALVPAIILPRSLALAAGEFLFAAFLAGAWGPIPIHVMELSPPEIQATVLGLSSQLGILASSASVTIQATIGERFPLPSKDGVKRYDYGIVIAIFTAGALVFVTVLALLGPELSKEERAERAIEAEYIERMRKQGLSMAEIGARRADLTLGAESPQPADSEEKNINIEHVDDQRTSDSPA